MSTRKLFTQPTRTIIRPTLQETFAITNGNETIKRNVLKDFAARELFDLELKDPEKKFRLISEKTSKEHITNDHGEIEPNGVVLKIF